MARSGTRGTDSRFASFLEFAMIGVLFALYLGSFDISSPVNNEEIFDQDSVHILAALHTGRPYPWNPQHHLLYHHLVERGVALWPGAPDDLESTYQFLETFTALCGLGFLLAFRHLLRGMGIGTLKRTLMIALVGVSITAWGAFSTIETHCLAMPFLVLFLAALRHMVGAGRASPADRLLLIGSLTIVALARIEMAGLAAATAIALLHPGFRVLRRALVVDLALVAVLSGTATLWLASDYLDVSWRRAARKVLLRGDRAVLADSLMRVDNLAPRHVVSVGRAVSAYAIVMPLGGTPRSMGVGGPVKVRYFTEPLTRMFSRPLAGAALVAVLLLLGVTSWKTLRQAARGDPFVALTVILWIGGLVAYTWFNPFEPYLWIFPFGVMTMTLVAETSRAGGWLTWGALAVIALVVAAHNFQAFCLTMR